MILMVLPDLSYYAPRKLQKRRKCNPDPIPKLFLNENEIRDLYRKD